MPRQIVLRAPPSAVDRRQPLLQSSDYSSRGGTRTVRVAEVAGGTMAECAAVCCCCPCGLANLLVLVVYKVPAGLCRKALRRKRHQRLVALLFFSGAAADPNDERCLTHLSQSLVDPFRNLQNWTKSTFANPCQGFTSFLQGATCNNGRIYKLSLPNLSLKGTISPFLSNCTNLQALDLSSNSISGPIPPELQYLVNLAVLNLSSNLLSGPIPQQLALCAYLNVIDLHDNRLSGPIPQQLGLLVRLSVFDVSNNRLSGPIPGSLGNRSGNLPRFNASSYEGNRDLYGYPLPPMKSKGLSILAIVGIGLGSGLVSLVLSFTAVCVWLRVSEQKLTNEEEGKISQLMPDY